MPSEPGSSPAPLPEGRLHPLTLALAVVNTVRGMLLPVLVLLFAGRVSPLMAVVFVAFPTLALLAAAVRYFTFTYRIENGELITRQGIFDRTERHIPLSRVQDVRMEQSALHRLLGVFDVHVETGGGGQGAEASLSVLGQAEAERLRRAIFEQAALPDSAVPERDAPSAVIVRRISLPELIVAGLTSNHLASGLAVVFGSLLFLDDLLPEHLEQRYLRAIARVIGLWWEQGGANAWALGAAFFLAVLLIGVALSVFGSVALFYGFTLTRSGEDLHRAWGLLTRRASRLPRRRIQLLKIEESALRRLFGLATLRADTAGSPAPGGGGSTGRDVLLPILRRSEVEALLPEFLPDIGSAPEAWRRVSPLAIRRATGGGALPCSLLAAALFFLGRDAAALWPLALIPLVWALSVLGYRRFGYALDRGYFRTRRGISQRDTHIVPVRNIQAITLRQSPFDRRHGLAALHADTAGQTYTGGGPRITNLPWTEALALARTLAHEAARARYRW